jgi:hypothetical protein
VRFSTSTALGATTPIRAAGAVAAALLLPFSALAAASPAAVIARPAAEAACASAPIRSSGPVYYYCDCQAGAAPGCVAGDDASAGTSPDAPRRTVADARERFNALPAGGTVAFCRGGAFEVQGTAHLANAACRASKPCDWRDYAPPWGATAERPVFLAGTTHFLWMGRADHDEGYRFWNLDIRHTGGEGISFWFSSDVTDVDVCNVAGSGGDAAGVINPYVARLTIRNSRWSTYAKQGFIGGAEDLTIDANTFVDVGAMRGPQFHAIYLGGGGDPTSTPGGWRNERITNNEIRLQSCRGSPIAVHGRHVGVVIENNLLVATQATGGCYGMSVSNGGYPYSTWVRNASIRRNRLTIAGGGEGISLAGCAGCVVSDNTIALTDPASGHRGIAVPDAPARPGMSPPEQINTGTIVQNNSIYLASTGHGIFVGHEGEDYVVENNAVWTAGPSCYGVTRPTLRQAGNYCRAGKGPRPEQLWVDPARGDLRPAPGSPLLGAGSAAHYSPRALSPAWSPGDEGVPRRPPVAAGAFQR